MARLAVEAARRRARAPAGGGRRPAGGGGRTYPARAAGRPPKRPRNAPESWSAGTRWRANPHRRDAARRPATTPCPRVRRCDARPRRPHVAGAPPQPAAAAAKAPPRTVLATSGQRRLAGIHRHQPTLSRRPHRPAAAGGMRGRPSPSRGPAGRQPDDRPLTVDHGRTLPPPGGTATTSLWVVHGAAAASGWGEPPRRPPAWRRGRAMGATEPLRAPRQRRAATLV